MNVLLVALNVFRRLRHDLLTVFMIGTIPLIFILLFGYAFSGTPTDVRVIVVDQDRGTLSLETREFGRITVEESLSDELVAGFGKKVFHIRRMEDVTVAEKELKEGRVWAVIAIQPGFSQGLFDRVLRIKGELPYTYHGRTIHLLPGEKTPSEPGITLSIDRSNVPVVDTVVATVERALNNLLFAYIGGKEVDLGSLLKIDYVYAGKADYIDYYSPGVIGFAVTVITSMLTLIALVREEKNGILERLLTFPVHP